MSSVHGWRGDLLAFASEHGEPFLGGSRIRAIWREVRAAETADFSRIGRAESLWDLISAEVGDRFFSVA